MQDFFGEVYVAQFWDLSTLPFLTLGFNQFTIFPRKILQESLTPCVQLYFSLNSDKLFF